MARFYFSRSNSSNAIKEFDKILSDIQKQHIEDRNEDFWILINTKDEVVVQFIDDEG